MQRVIASVLHSYTGNYAIVNRSIGHTDADGNTAFPSSVKIGDATYEVTGCSGSENHEIWTPANREGEKSLPGWLRGYKVTFATSGTFKEGDKLSVEDEVPAETELKVMGNVAPLPEVPPEVVLPFGVAPDPVEAPAIPPEAEDAPSGVEPPLDNPEGSE